MGEGEESVHPSLLDGSRDDLAKTLHHHGSLAFVLSHQIKDQVSTTSVDEPLDLVPTIVRIAGNGGIQRNFIGHLLGELDELAHIPKSLEISMSDPRMLVTKLGY